MNNARPIGYQMTKKMFNAILNTRATEEELNKNPYEYVMSVINDEYGLRGRVTHISIYNN